jgi:hypothetical protein
MRLNALVRLENLWKNLKELLNYEKHSFIANRKTK